MSKTWQAYAHHSLDVGAKIDRIQARGDLTQDEVLYDASLSGILCLRHSMSKRSIYANESKDRGGGHSGIAAHFV